MLARNSSEIQFARTGTVGSASAAGVVTALPVAMASSKTASFPAISRDALRDPVRRVNQVVMGESFGQLAALRVPQPDPVADAEPVGRRAGHRRLHLTRTLDLGQLQPRGPERRGQPVRRPAAGGDVAAAEQGGYPRRRAAAPPAARTAARAAGGTSVVVASIGIAGIRRNSFPLARVLAVTLHSVRSSKRSRS